MIHSGAENYKETYPWNPRVSFLCSYSPKHTGCNSAKFDHFMMNDMDILFTNYPHTELWNMKINAE
jgi:hypothetical protein